MAGNRPWSTGNIEGRPLPHSIRIFRASGSHHFTHPASNRSDDLDVSGQTYPSNTYLAHDQSARSTVVDLVSRLRSMRHSSSCARFLPGAGFVRYVSGVRQRIMTENILQDRGVHT